MSNARIYALPFLLSHVDELDPIFRASFFCAPNGHARIDGFQNRRVGEQTPADGGSLSLRIIRVFVVGCLAWRVGVVCRVVEAAEEMGEAVGEEAAEGGLESGLAGARFVGRRNWDLPCRRRIRRCLLP